METGLIIKQLTLVASPRSVIVPRVYTYRLSKCCSFFMESTFNLGLDPTLSGTGTTTRNATGWCRLTDPNARPHQGQLFFYMINRQFLGSRRLVNTNYCVYKSSCGKIVTKQTHKYHSGSFTLNNNVNGTFYCYRNSLFPPYLFALFVRQTDQIVCVDF